MAIDRYRDPVAHRMSLPSVTHAPGMNHTAGMERIGNLMKQSMGSALGHVESHPPARSAAPTSAVGALVKLAGYGLLAGLALMAAGKKAGGTDGAT